MRLLFMLLAAAALSCGGPARIEVDPASLQLHAKGQTARVRAVALAGSGRTLPEKQCAWSSSDERVARVAARGNEAEVVATGPGTARVRCAVGAVAGEVVVVVRLVARVELEPGELRLRLLDRPEPATMSIRTTDEEGRMLSPGRLTTRCLDEAVCRGDDRAQVWPVGAGATTVRVEADGAAAERAVRVEDARSAAARPRPVKGNPMLEYEKAAAILQRDRQKAAEKK